MKTKSKKKRVVTIVIVILLVLVLAVVGMVAWVMNTLSSAGVMVTTTNATRGDLQESISTSGTIGSDERKVIFAPASGKLDEVMVAAGDTVKKGDMLVSYDMEAMDNMLKQAELQQNKTTVGYESALADNSSNQAKLKEANTNLPILEQQIKDHKAYLETLQEKLTTSQRETSVALTNESYNLSTRSAELQNTLATLKAALDPNAADYASKQAEIAQVQKQFEEVSSQMNHNQYLQQIAGSSDYVVELQKEIAEVQEKLAEFEAYKAEMESQKTSSENMMMDDYDKQQYDIDSELAGMNYASAEEQYNTAKQGVKAEFDGIVTECTAVQGSSVSEGMQLLVLENSNKIKVSFSASKYNIEKLAIGQKADVEIFDTTYEGEISKINRMATMTNSGTTMVGVEVKLTNPDDKIILGLDAKITVYTDKAEDTLMIPVEVINADKEGDFLYVVEEGIVVRKPIVCGISTDTHTEVLEGITEEDQIVEKAFGELREGMMVTIMPAEYEEALNAAGAMSDSGVSVSVGAAE